MTVMYVMVVSKVCKVYHELPLNLSLRENASIDIMKGQGTSKIHSL